MNTAVLDHLILGIADLDEGIEWIRDKTGVAPVAGGTHPGAGTRNALLSLGNRQYLEIMSIDPQQNASSRLAGLIRKTRNPRLITWAVATADIDSVSQLAEAKGYKFEGPAKGSRMKPDGGSELKWKTLRILEDDGGVIPFFIEWDREILHPSEDSPQGCFLNSFEIHHPQADLIRGKLRSLGIDAGVVQDTRARLRAVLSTPKGSIQIL